MTSRWIADRALAIGAVVLGFVVAIAGAIVSRMYVPIGLVLVVVTTGMFFWTARTLLARLGVIGAALGWAAGIVVCLWPRAEGDIVLASDLPGIVFLLGGVLLAAWNVGRTLGESPPPPSWTGGTR